jgi:hypothetical protein
MTTSSTETPTTAPETKRRKPRLRHLAPAAALLAIVALAASGCGGGGGSKSSNGSTSPGTSGTDSAQQSGIAYAQCMRSHGVTNFPDNAITSTGNGTTINLPAGISNNPDYQSASQACRQYLPSGANGGNGTSNNAAVQAEINFAACMRSHGEPNFPEPNASGGVIISGSSGIDPNSPTFQSAMQACQSILQNAGLNTSPGGGS